MDRDHRVEREDDYEYGGVASFGEREIRTGKGNGDEKETESEKEKGINKCPYSSNSSILNQLLHSQLLLRLPHS